ncbi:unnamed protein product, partial [Ectocarpus sp. 6 AP-2014]
AAFATASTGATPTKNTTSPRNGKGKVRHPHVSTFST